MSELKGENKKKLLEELEKPHLINTYEKIINQSKESLHKFIDSPNDETWTEAIQNLSCSPFLEGEYTDHYDVHEDHLGEIRDKLNVLVDLFMQYYIEFVRRGLEYDKLVRKYVEELS